MDCWTEDTESSMAVDWSSSQLLPWDWLYHSMQLRCSGEHELAKVTTAYSPSQKRYPATECVPDVRGGDYPSVWQGQDGLTGTS